MRTCPHPPPPRLPRPPLLRRALHPPLPPHPRLRRLPQRLKPRPRIPPHRGLGHRPRRHRPRRRRHPQVRHLQGRHPPPRRPRRPEVSQARAAKTRARQAPLSSSQRPRSSTGRVRGRAHLRRKGGVPAPIDAGQGASREVCRSPGAFIKGVRWPATSSLALEVAWVCANGGTGPPPQLRFKRQELRLGRSGLGHNPKRSIVPVRSPCKFPDRSPSPLFVPLFTPPRRQLILRTWPRWSSANFGVTFYEVRLLASATPEGRLRDA